jgi:hypothetical protein
MQFRKYEMTEAEWNTLKDTIPQDTIAIELGFIDEAKQNAYSLDIIWSDKEPNNFSKYKVWPEPIGYHSFGYDIDQDYINAYYSR